MEIKSYLGKPVILLAETMNGEGDSMLYETIAHNHGTAHIKDRLRRAGDVPLYDREQGKVLSVPIVAHLSPSVEGLPPMEDGVILIVPEGFGRFSFRNDVYQVHDIIEETEDYIKCRALQVP